jgi:diaminopimelate epimerase
VVVITNGGLLKIYISSANEEIFLEGPVEIAFRGKYLKEDIS